MAIRARKRSTALPGQIQFAIIFVALVTFVCQHRLLQQEPLPTSIPYVPMKTWDGVRGGIPQSKPILGGSDEINPKPKRPLQFDQCRILNETKTIPRLPHFIIAGAQKCGTTALFEFLSEHPEIQPSKGPETHFFDWYYPGNEDPDQWLQKNNFSASLRGSDLRCAVKWNYAQHFDYSEDKKIFFEKTPSYLFLTKTPELIATTCPWKPKIVIILRNPINRAFSHFQMKIRTFGKSFEELIDEEVGNLRKIGLSKAPHRTWNYTPDDHRFAIPNLSVEKFENLFWKHYRGMFTNNYIQRGMYMAQIRHWLPYFPLNESLLVLNYEAFQSHPEEVFGRLLDFIGASPFTPTDGFGTVHNKRGLNASAIAPETRRYLSAIFRPYNDLLADTLGDEWRGVWD